MGYGSKESGFTTQEMILFFGCVALSFFLGRNRKLAKKQSLPQGFDEKQELKKILREAGLGHLELTNRGV